MKKFLSFSYFLLFIPYFLLSQNIGIGTNTPVQKLQVEGTTYLNGNVGIRHPNPSFPLSFSEDLGDKISLWSNSGNSYGFGIQGSLLQIHTDIPLADIAFGYGSSDGFTETLRIKGNGNVGIGTSVPAYPLSFNGNLGDKISLWSDGSGAHYGMGIQSGLLQLFSQNPFADIAFGYGSSIAFTERMRVKGNGNVGIGTSNPQFLLDINNRIRIGSGGDLANSAGIWLNKTDNSALQAFIGIENDNYVGFYGISGAGWKFGMNTQNGALKINGTEGQPGQVLISNGNSSAAGFTTIGNVINTVMKNSTIGQVDINTLGVEFLLPQISHTITLTRKSRLIICANVAFQQTICLGCVDATGHLKLKVDNAEVTYQSYGIAASSLSNASIANFMIDLNSGTHTIDFYVRGSGGPAHFAYPKSSSIILLPVD